jgi:putative ABC transport system permease protein
MLVQMGFEDALMTSAGVHIRALDCDLIIASPNYQYLLQPGAFAERRMYQAGGDGRVDSIAPLYLSGLTWTNPQTRQHRMILVMGVPPRRGVFRDPVIDSQIAALKDPEAALYDSKGRTEYGPVAKLLSEGQTVATEVSNRRVVIAGLFEIGTTFGVDGTIVVSDVAFLRMMPGRERGSVALGLIRLRPGADPDRVRDDLEGRLPNDVRVYTREGFVTHEQHYWSTNTPVGFLFKLGVALGLFVGLIIVYQILYTDVIEHLKEYATLKAIGYTDWYLGRVVLQQGLILSWLGFIPGALIAEGVYRVTAGVTFLPLGMTMRRMLAVYALTAAMCVVGAALAIRPVRTTNPADLVT